MSFTVCSTVSVLYPAGQPHLRSWTDDRVWRWVSLTWIQRSEVRYRVLLTTFKSSLPADLYYCTSWKLYVWFSSLTSTIVGIKTNPPFVLVHLWYHLFWPCYVRHVCFHARMVIWVLHWGHLCASPLSEESEAKTCKFRNTGQDFPSEWAR